jgi:hypothetical protein
MCCPILGPAPHPHTPYRGSLPFPSLSPTPRHPLFLPPPRFLHTPAPYPLSSDPSYIDLPQNHLQCSSTFHLTVPDLHEHPTSLCVLTPLPTPISTKEFLCPEGELVDCRRSHTRVPNKDREGHRGREAEDIGLSEHRDRDQGPEGSRGGGAGEEGVSAPRERGTRDEIR